MYTIVVKVKLSSLILLIKNVFLNIILQYSGIKFINALKVRIYKFTILNEIIMFRFEGVGTKRPMLNTY